MNSKKKIVFCYRRCHRSCYWWYDKFVSFSNYQRNILAWIYYNFISSLFKSGCVH